MLMTATGLDDHVPVALENDIGVVVEVEDRDGGELGGGTAGLGHQVGVQEVHQRLHDGVVGGVHVSTQRKGALPVAVERGVAIGSNDPVLEKSTLVELCKY